MRHGISRYMLRQLVTALVFVIICLTGAIWLTQSLRFVDLIVNRGLPLETFVLLVLLLLPAFLLLALPVAAFAATLFTYNRMISDSEMVVLQAAGFGPARLARPVLVLGLMCTLAAYVLSLWLMPYAYRSFKDMQFFIRENYANVLLREGVFTTLMEGVTVFIRARSEDGTLVGLMIHDGRDARQPVTLIARKGAIISTPTGPRVVLEDGNRQAPDEKGRLTLLYFDRYTVELGGTNREMIGRWREPQERYLHELFDLDGENEVNRRKLIAEAHNRLALPLLNFCLPLLGIAFLLTGDYSRRGNGIRIAAAVVAVAGLQAAFVGASYVAARNSAAVALMYLPPAVALIGAMTALYSGIRLRRPAAMAAG